MSSRISSDESDRKKIREKLQTCIDPLDVIQLKDNVLVNIYSGKIADKSVNVYNSVNIVRT